jgi:hypothetical protein
MPLLLPGVDEATFKTLTQRTLRALKKQQGDQALNRLTLTQLRTAMIEAMGYAHWHEAQQAWAPKLAPVAPPSPIMNEAIGHESGWDLLPEPFLEDPLSEDTFFPTPYTSVRPVFDETDWLAGAPVSWQEAWQAADQGASALVRWALHHGEGLGLLLWVNPVHMHPANRWDAPLSFCEALLRLREPELGWPLYQALLDAAETHPEWALIPKISHVKALWQNSLKHYQLNNPSSRRQAQATWSNGLATWWAQRLPPTEMDALLAWWWQPSEHWKRMHEWPLKPDDFRWPGQQFWDAWHKLHPEVEPSEPLLMLSTPHWEVVMTSLRAGAWRNALQEPWILYRLIQTIVEHNREDVWDTWVDLLVHDPEKLVSLKPGLGHCATPVTFHFVDGVQQGMQWTEAWLPRVAQVLSQLPPAPPVTELLLNTLSQRGETVAFETLFPLCLPPEERDRQKMSRLLVNIVKGDWSADERQALIQRCVQPDAAMWNTALDHWVTWFLKEQVENERLHRSAPPFFDRNRFEEGLRFLVNHGAQWTPSLVQHWFETTDFSLEWAKLAKETGCPLHTAVFKPEEWRDPQRETALQAGLRTGAIPLYQLDGWAALGFPAVSQWPEADLVRWLWPRFWNDRSLWTTERSYHDHPVVRDPALLADRLAFFSQHGFTPDDPRLNQAWEWVSTPEQVTAWAHWTDTLPVVSDVARWLRHPQCGDFWTPPGVQSRTLEDPAERLDAMIHQALTMGTDLCEPLNGWQGWTLLHLAAVLPLTAGDLAQAHTIQLLQRLLDAGLDIMARNDQGHTALDVLEQRQTQMKHDDSLYLKKRQQFLKAQQDQATVLRSHRRRPFD